MLNRGNLMQLNEIIEWVTDECKATRCEYNRGNGKCSEDGNCRKVKDGVLEALNELKEYRRLGTINYIKKIL